MRTVDQEVACHIIMPFLQATNLLEGLAKLSTPTLARKETALPGVRAATFLREPEKFVTTWLRRASFVWICSKAHPHCCSSIMQKNRQGSTRVLALEKSANNFTGLVVPSFCSAPQGAEVVGDTLKRA